MTLPLFLVVLISGLQAHVLERKAGAYDGVVVYRTHGSSTGILVDTDGVLLNVWDLDTTSSVGPYLHANGDVVTLGLVDNPDPLYCCGTAGEIRQFSFNNTLVRHIVYHDDTKMLHHDFAELPNGNILAISWDVLSLDEAQTLGRNISLGLDTEGKFVADKLVEFDPSGAVVWEWRAVDHVIQDIDINRSNYGFVEDFPELIDINVGTPRYDWTHFNAVDYNAELDQVMVSVRQFQELWILDHSTTTLEAAGHSGGRSGKGGDILYRWGNPAMYRRGNESDRVFGHQHDCNWIPSGFPGAGNIMVFNNKGTRLPGVTYSAGLEFTPPTPDANGLYPLGPGQTYGPADIIREIRADPPQSMSSQFMGAARRLPNGNTLITAADMGELFEFDASGELVWRWLNTLRNDNTIQNVTSPSSFPSSERRMFRAYKLPRDFIDLDSLQGVFDPECLLEDHLDLSGTNCTRAFNRTSTESGTSDGASLCSSVAVSVAIAVVISVTGLGIPV